MPDKLKWTDVEDIGIELSEKHPDVDPLTVRFTDLRRMVEDLDEFEAEPGHHVNEQILEAIQAAWYEEYQDAGGQAKGESLEVDEGERYVPPSPFKPD